MFYLTTATVHTSLPLNFRLRTFASCVDTGDCLRNPGWNFLWLYPPGVLSGRATPHGLYIYARDERAKSPVQVVSHSYRGCCMRMGFHLQGRCIIVSNGCRLSHTVLYRFSSNWCIIESLNLLCCSTAALCPRDTSLLWWQFIYVILASLCRGTCRV